MAAWFVLGLLACWWRGPASLGLTLDNQHYFFIAERAASGVPPHVSHFDSKHALSMLITAGAIRVGRAVGADDVQAARVASIATLAAAVAAAYAVTAAISPGTLAGHLAGLAMLGFDGLLWMGAMGARPKVFLVLFCLLTAWAVARRRPLAAGIAAGSAFLCWQPALLIGAAALPMVALGPRPGRALARLGMGFLVCVALYELYFLAHGALGEQLEQSYRFPALYMSQPDPDLLRSAVGFLNLFEGFSRQSPLRIVFFVALLGFWASALRRPRALPSRIAREPGLVYVFACGTATLAFTLYDYQSYVDTFFVLPFVAVVCGWTGGVVVDWLARDRPPAWRGPLAGTLLLGFLAQTAVRPERAQIGPRLDDQRRLASSVGRFLEEGHSVYAVGCTHLLAMNHADNHVRYGFFFRGMDAYMQTRANAPDGYRPLRDGAMPELILISRPFVPGGKAWLEREYREITPPKFRRQGVRVWRRNDPEGP